MKKFIILAILLLLACVAIVHGIIYTKSGGFNPYQAAALEMLRTAVCGQTEDQCSGDRVGMALMTTPGAEGSIILFDNYLREKGILNAYAIALFGFDRQDMPTDPEQEIINRLQSN